MLDGLGNGGRSQLEPVKKESLMNRQLGLLCLALAVAMAGCRESTELNKADTVRSRVSDTNDQNSSTASLTSTPGALSAAASSAASSSAAASSAAASCSSAAMAQLQAAEEAVKVLEAQLEKMIKEGASSGMALLQKRQAIETAKATASTLTAAAKAAGCAMTAGASCSSAAMAELQAAEAAVKALEAKLATMVAEGQGGSMAARLLRPQIETAVARRLALKMAAKAAGCFLVMMCSLPVAVGQEILCNSTPTGPGAEINKYDACEVAASARIQLDMLKASLDVLNAQLKVAINAKEANAVACSHSQRDPQLCLTIAQRLIIEIDSLNSKIRANQDTAALVTAQYAREKVRCDNFTCNDEVQPVFESCQSDCFANSPDTLRECQQGCQDDAEKNRHDCLASLEDK